MFKIGEYIIYKRDLCQVVAIEKNTNEEYYKLTMPNDTSLTIKVPVSNKLGYLRYPLTQKEAEQLIDDIPSIEEIKTTDKLLENTYKTLMKTNLHEDLIKIIKTTYLRNKERLNNKKKLGDKDLTYFNQAEKLLYTELSYSLNIPYDQCKNYIIEKITTNEKETTNEN